MSATLLTAFLACLAPTPSPRLVFSAADLPELRRRCAEPELAAVFASLQREADSLVARGAALRDEVDAGGSDRIVIRAHTWGRRLSDRMETLGFVHQITGDPQYGDLAAALLVDSAAKLPAAREEIAGSFAGARGDLMRGFALGLDWAGERLTPEQRRVVEGVAADYVRNILAEANREKTWWVPHHNFIGVAVGAAGCLAILLEDAYPAEAPGWREEATRLVNLFLDQGFDEQGAYYEGIGYASYGLSNGTLFADALLRAGGPNLFEHLRLRRVPHFFAMSQLPGERIFDARNDSGYAGVEASMLLLAGRQNSELAKWLWNTSGGGASPFRIVWDNAVEPVAPPEAGEPWAEHFVGRGLVVFRTGWTLDDVMYSIEAGPYYPVTHNQADKGHFTLYGLGGRWAIDSGYGNNREPEGRAQTVAHNCVLIDGGQQALSGAGTGTNGEITAYETSELEGYTLADATEAYQRNNQNQPGAGAEKALRHSLFVRPADGLPAYAVVFDDIRKDDAEHAYTWLLHTADANEIELLSDGVRLSPAGTGGGYVETPAGSDGRGRCEWTVEVAEAGTYELWARVRAGGEQPAQSDSFLVQVDDGPVWHWHMPSSRVWTWGRVSHNVPATEVSVELTAGRHTIRLMTREPAAQVDKIAFAPLGEADPPLFRNGQRTEAEDAAVTAPMLVIDDPTDVGSRCRVHLTAAAPVAFEVDSFFDHPRLKATATAVEPRFAAVLIPLPENRAEPGIRSEETGVERVVTIDWGQRTDVITWSPGSRPTRVRR